MCIGGVNASNCQRIRYQSIAEFKSINGIAVVSAIIGADDPKEAAEELRELVWAPAAFDVQQRPLYHGTHEEIQERVPPVVAAVAEANPLCHNMTNLVVQNFAANVALCMLVSPPISTTRPRRRPRLAARRLTDHAAAAPRPSCPTTASKPATSRASAARSSSTWAP